MSSPCDVCNNDCRNCDDEYSNFNSDKIRKIIADAKSDRDRLQAEVERLEKLVVAWDKQNDNTLRELFTMTALAEKYKGLLDDSVSLLMNCNQRDGLWEEDYEELMQKYDAITRIQNQDKERGL